MATYWRQMELDVKTMVRGTAVIERALGDGSVLTRAELGEALRRAGMPLVTYRLGHLALYAELEGVICSGPRRGKQPTYALLATRAPKARQLDRDEALGELVRRYFQSHGPATVQDFVWWSGLTTPDATRGLEIARAGRHEQDGRLFCGVGAGQARTRAKLAHLLPIYDEYLIAYKRREAIPDGASKITSAYGRPVNFQHAVIVDGRVTGTWRITRTARAIAMRATMLRRLSTRETRALAHAAKRYERFHGVPVVLTIE
jgi:hypothetical protein